MDAGCEVRVGYVTRVEPGSLHIAVERGEACESCRLKGSCLIDQTRMERMCVSMDSTGYRSGDRVEVRVSTRRGLRAVLFAYFVPFILILTSLIVFLSLGHSELVSGLFSLLLLVPYYIILHIFQGRTSNMVQVRKA